VTVRTMGKEELGTIIGRCGVLEDYV